MFKMLWAICLASISNHSASPAALPEPVPPCAPTPADVLSVANNTVAVASTYVSYSTLLLGILALLVAFITILINWHMGQQQTVHVRTAIKKLLQDKERL
jgi:hypothetical protein